MAKTKENKVSKRYRLIFGTAAILAILAVGGIAAAEQGGNAGGNSADHRQNPTTTTAGPEAESTTTTTTTTLAPAAKPKGAENEGEGEAESADTPDGLCEVALWNASDQGVANGEAFQRCPNYAERLAASVVKGQGHGGPPEDAGQGQGQGQGGPDNLHSQGHGKP